MKNSFLLVILAILFINQSGIIKARAIKGQLMKIIKNPSQQYCMDVFLKKECYPFSI
jgi:hypothetical protein